MQNAKCKMNDAHPFRGLGRFYCGVAVEVVLNER